MGDMMHREHHLNFVLICICLKFVELFGLRMEGMQWP
jgi:hypothetical protein